MRESRFAIGEITTPNWDLGQCIEAWCRYEVPAMGLSAATLEVYGRKRGIQELKDSGLAVTNYQGIGCYGFEQPRISEVIDSLVDQMDAAAELGVDCVFVMSGPRKHLSWQDSAKQFVDALHMLLPHAKERGLKLAIEPIHPMRQDLSFINTARDTYDLVKQVDDPSLGYVFDFWHLWFDPLIDDIISQSAHSIFNVQISDHKKMTLRTLDRTVPGEGIAPCASMLRAIEKAGYQGYYEMEILSPDNEEMGYPATIERSIESYRQLVKDAMG